MESLREAVATRPALGAGRSACIVPLNDELVLRLGGGVDLSKLSESDFSLHPNYPALKESGVGYVIFQGPGDINIQRRIHGASYPKVHFPRDTKEEEEFITGLRASVSLTESISAMPIDSYRRLVDDLTLLTRLRETIDANRDNFLIDAPGQALHLIDISDPDCHECSLEKLETNNAPSQILPLLLGSHALYVEGMYWERQIEWPNDWAADHMEELGELRNRWRAAASSIVDSYLQVLAEKRLPFSVPGQSASSYLESYEAYSLRQTLDEMRLTRSEQATLMDRLNGLNRNAANAPGADVPTPRI